MYIQWSPVEVQAPAHLEPDRPQCDRPAARIVAQQYSSATCISLRFYYRKEKFGLHIKILFFQLLLLFKNCLSLKLRNLELLKSGSVCYT
jgi:hypothetical protein